MAYEKEEPSEEYLDMLMGILMDFYTEQEIQKIYDKNIIIDSYGIIMNENKWIVLPKMEILFIKKKAIQSRRTESIVKNYKHN